MCFHPTMPNSALQGTLRDKAAQRHAKYNLPSTSQMHRSTPSKSQAQRPAVVMGEGKATIAELPNLGPKSQQMLLASGIASVEQLRELGSVAAYARVKARHKSASLNLLWALEGALSGLPWQEVARQHRTSLLLSLEQLQNGG